MQPIKGEVYKFYQIKLKNICSLKGAIKKVERKATNWEEIQ